MRLDVVEVAGGVFQARTRYVAWVIVVDGREVTLVDTGWPGDRDRVLASLRQVGRSGTDIAAIVLTHGHRDHQGSADWLQKQYDLPVEVHELEKPNAQGTRVEEVPIPTLLRMAWRPSILVSGLSMLALGALSITYVQDVTTCSDGVVDVPGRPVCVHTPGHTSGHAALHLPERGVLIAGDALMTQHPAAPGAPGAQLLPDFFNHDTEQAVKSLERLRALEADVVVPGHGPPYRGTPASAVAEALARRH